MSPIVLLNLLYIDIFYFYKIDIFTGFEQILKILVQSYRHLYTIYNTTQYMNILKTVLHIFLIFV